MVVENKYTQSFVILTQINHNYSNYQTFDCLVFSYFILVICIWLICSVFDFLHLIILYSKTENKHALIELLILVCWDILKLWIELKFSDTLRLKFYFGISLFYCFVKDFSTFLHIAFLITEHLNWILYVIFHCYW